MNTKKKHKTQRCSYEGCNKKLFLTDFACNCEKKFCQLHRLPEAHECKIDYKTKAKERLKKRLLSEKTVADKIIRI